MRFHSWVAVLLLAVASLPTAAFDTVDGQIDHYLVILEGTDQRAKIAMLKRLQWSGLSDPRLFDVIEAAPLAVIDIKKLDKPTLQEATHKIRTLGYSGNEKYRASLSNLKQNAANRKMRGHAAKALLDLDRFGRWNRQIAASNVKVEGKSAEVTNYMKMLGVDDVLVQRLAARAIFHEKRKDPDLLGMVAEKLKAMHAREGLNGAAQDTGAWYAKALGQSGNYRDLLVRVNQDSPYKKIKKHSLKFIQ